MSETRQAAGIIAISPQGRILMCRRTDGEGWAFPGGGLKDGEDAEKAAVREFFEETGYRIGGVGKLHMRNVRNGVDFSTYVRTIEDEFIPKLNHEHSAWGWFTPKEILSEGHAMALPAMGQAPSAEIADARTDDFVESEHPRVKSGEGGGQFTSGGGGGGSDLSASEMAQRLAPAKGGISASEMARRLAPITKAATGPKHEAHAKATSTFMAKPKVNGAIKKVCAGIARNTFGMAEDAAIEQVADVMTEAVKYCIGAAVVLIGASLSSEAVLEGGAAAGSLGFVVKYTVKKMAERSGINDENAKKVLIGAVKAMLGKKVFADASDGEDDEDSVIAALRKLLEILEGDDDIEDNPDTDGLKKVADSLDRLFGRADEFREQDHPRGQPGNAGQFGPGGGGKKAEPSKWTGAKGVEEENSEKAVTGKPITVMRHGSETGGLGGRNAGNLRAVANHLVNTYDYEAPQSSGGTGNTISAYHTTLPEDVGEYERSNAGSGAGAKVGRRAHTNERGDLHIAYSFPKDHQGERVASIPISEVIDELKKSGYADPDEAGINKTEEALRAVMARHESEGEAKGESKGHASKLFEEHPSSGATADQIIASFPGMAQKIAGVKNKLEGALPTDQVHKKNGEYTPERKALHNQIVRKIFSPEAVKAARPPPGQRPTVTFLGGRGGSGKSWLTKEGEGPVDGAHAITLNSDDVQEEFPEYEGWNAALTHDEAAEIVENAENVARGAGLNVILDATMRTDKNIKKKLERFQKAGYDVKGYYMFLPPEDAAKRALQRFDRGGPKGRFVPPEYTLSSTGNEKTFDALTPAFSHWGVYKNTGKAPELVKDSGS